MNPEDYSPPIASGGVYYSNKTNTLSDDQINDMMRKLQSSSRRYSTAPYPTVDTAVGSFTQPEPLPDPPEGWGSVMDGKLFKCPSCKSVIDPEDVRGHEEWHMGMLDPI